MSVYLNYDGYHSAKQMIGHGKVDEGPFELTDEDERKMLGPEGTDIQEHSRHHLGVDEDKPWTSPKRNRYPIGKEGRLFTQAVHSVRNQAHENGHEDIRDAASKLLGHFKLAAHPDERSLEIEEDRKIVKKADGYHVMSEDGKKSLGGPYKTEAEAKKRLSQVEFFKHKGENSLNFEPERRILLPIQAELRVAKGSAGQRKIIGYAAVFNKMSQNLGGFQEKVHEKAFEQVLKTADVRGLRNHDPDKLLGRTKSGTLRLEPDDAGLRYEIDVPDTQVGRDTVTDIERGDLDGSSFSFTVDPGGDEWDETTSPPTRTLMNVRDLFDVGPVSYPAYLDTEVHARNLQVLAEFRANRLKKAGPNEAHIRRIRLLEMKLGCRILSLP